MEEEMKLRVAALAPVRAALRRLPSARPAHPRQFEENWVLDDGADSLIRRGLLLRVRQWGGRAILTFKGVAAYEAGVKRREEVECELDDANQLLTIFSLLGYHVSRRYQKWREIWEVDGVEVALDETPMGPFVELEGARAVLRTLAESLGLDPATAAAGSYSELWIAWRDEHPDAPRDMIFT